MENVEIVRGGYEHYNRTGQADYAHLDEDVECDVSDRTFDRAVYHGHEGVREFMSLLREQWATLRIEPQEFIVSGDDVVVPVRLIARGKQSGVETTANAAHVWTLRGQMVIRYKVFQTLHEALEAVGNRE
jgi:ketosteroid isomerase-like protein